MSDGSVVYKCYIFISLIEKTKNMELDSRVFVQQLKIAVFPSPRGYMW